MAMDFFKILLAELTTELHQDEKFQNMSVGEFA